jgi:hypothetical protein
MRIHTVSLWSVSLGCLLAIGLDGAARHQPPATLNLDLTTIHAAVLSSARGDADSADAPYLLISIAGSSGSTQARTLPGSGHWNLRADQAITGLPIASISLEPGDSVRILLSALEDRAATPDELEIASATTVAMAKQRSWSSPLEETMVTAALTPLTSRGVHWLGSASLLVTNQGGTAYWTRLDCIASCAVLRSPAQNGGAVLSETAGPASGVVELTGASGTYHVQVALRRVP